MLVGVDAAEAANRELLFTWPALVGDAEGVDCRSCDGDTGDSGRRKGELRGEEENPPPPASDEVLRWLVGRAWFVLMTVSMTWFSSASGEDSMAGQGWHKPSCEQHCRIMHVIWRIGGASRGGGALVMLLLGLAVVVRYAVDSMRDR